MTTSRQGHFGGPGEYVGRCCWQGQGADLYPIQCSIVTRAEVQFQKTRDGI